MHERFASRIVEGLESLGRRIQKSKQALDHSQVERQIGRLLERNSRSAGSFSIHVHEDPSHPSGLRLSWKQKTRWAQWANLSQGTYVLRSNVNDWSAEDLWTTYIQLTEAEAAFRTN